MARIYVRKDGNDTFPGDTEYSAKLTLAGALSVVAAYDTIDVGQGSFDLGNAVLNLPDWVNLVGQGYACTEITSSADLAALGCIIKPGTNSYCAGFTVRGTAATGVFQGPIGYNRSGSVNQTPFSFCVVADVRIVGDSDGVYIRDAQGGSAYLVGRNLVIDTKYDAVAVIDSNATVELFNPRLRVQGPSPCGPAQNATCARTGKVDMATPSPTIIIHGGFGKSSGGGLGNVGLSAGYYGTIIAEGFKIQIDASGTSHSLVAMSQTGYTSGALTVIDCVYDPSSVSGTVNVLSRAASGVTLAAAQPNYAPAKAGDAMTLTAGEREAVAADVCSQIPGTDDILSGISGINIDSTGAPGSLTLVKAMEVIFAGLAGKASYNAATGVYTLFGRDGTTPLADITLAGSGNRSAVTIH